MHKTSKFLIVILLLLNITAFGQAGANKFRFNGVLSNEGIVISSGYVDFRFRVFELPTGGSQLGSDVVVTNISVTNGNYSVIVDLSQGPYVNGQSYWIEAGVRFAPAEAFFPFTTLSPRKQFTIGTSHGLRIFRQPGITNFVVPAGVHQLLVEVWGAGGGGANTNSAGYYGGPGGGGGGYAKGFLPVIPGTTNAIVIGMGGFAATGFGHGLKGEDSTVSDPQGNVLLLCTGGLGGTNLNGDFGIYGIDLPFGSGGGGAGGLGDANMFIHQDGQKGSLAFIYHESGIQYSDYPGGNGGKAALGSAQTGEFGYDIDGTTESIGTDYIHPTWSLQSITFGQGGEGGGFRGGPRGSPSNSKNGTAGCVIVQW